QHPIHFLGAAVHRELLHQRLGDSKSQTGVHHSKGLCRHISRLAVRQDAMGILAHIMFENPSALGVNMAEAFYRPDTSAVPYSISLLHVICKVERTILRNAEFLRVVTDEGEDVSCVLGLAQVDGTLRTQGRCGKLDLVNYLPRQTGPIGLIPLVR